MSEVAHSTRNGQQSRSAETRAAILDAAGRVFAEGGLAGARTDAIAAAAGVNKAMLYYYFKSKRRLYEAVVEEYFAELNREALAVLTAPGPAGEILMQYVSAYFDFISERRRYAPLFQQMMLTGGPPLERVVRRHFAPRSVALDRLLERGMRSGEFRRADRSHTALSIVALIVFYFSAARVLQVLGPSDAYSEVGLKRRKKEVIDFIRHAVFRAPADRRTKRN
jgi:TetR/AcrR family transcriptional regulator